MGNLYLGLLHYPVRNRQGEIVTSALTGLDVPDIARSCRTYGVVRYYIIQPLASQREIAQRIFDYWEREERDQPHRREALQVLRVIDTLEASLADVFAIEGLCPLLVGTSARQHGGQPLSYEQLRTQLTNEEAPVYLLFGTGWGIAEEVLARLDVMLPPVSGPGPYNHLSVRSAVAIILDRLRGNRETYDEL
jgi:hypothetical protein